MDLPGEVRNMIHELPLFTSSVDTMQEQLGPSYDLWHTAIPPSRAHVADCLQHLSPRDVEELRFFATFGTLSSLSQEIRKEAKSLFRSKHWLDFGGAMGHPEYRYDVLGPGRVAAVWYLRPDMYRFEIGDFGAAALAGLLPSLPRWQGLRELTLVSHVSKIYGNDQQELETWFLKGEEIVSHRLERFAKALESLPQLRGVRITLTPSFRSSYYML
jgi:hypothetical protein